MEPMALGSPGTSPVYPSSPVVGFGSAGGGFHGATPTAAASAHWGHPGATSSPFASAAAGGGAVGTPGSVTAYGHPQVPPAHGTPITVNVGAGGSGFLPGYLMGDFNQQVMLQRSQRRKEFIGFFFSGIR